MYKIANITFECNFLTPLMQRKSEFYMLNSERCGNADFNINYTLDDLEKCHKMYKHLSMSQCEKIYSLKNTFEALLERDCFIAHASVISVKNSGIIFFGSRDSGKSTQATIWKNYFGSEVEMISDDRPILKRDRDCLYAWNTPWSDYQSSSTIQPYTEIKAACILNKSIIDEAVRVMPEGLIECISNDYPIKLQNMINSVLSLLLEDIPCFQLYNTADEQKLDLLREELLL